MRIRRKGVVMRTVSTNHDLLGLVRDVRQTARISPDVLDTDYCLFPDVSHDNDTNLMNQTSLMKRIDGIIDENFNKFFLKPYSRTTILISKLEFPTFIYRDLSLEQIPPEELVNLIGELLTVVLRTNNLDFYISYVRNLHVDQFVRVESTKTIAIVPFSPKYIHVKISILDILKEKDENIRKAIQYIHLRLSNRNRINADVLDRSFNHIVSRYWDLPSEAEIVEYSIERIMNNGEICHPVLKDDNGELIETSRTNRYIRIKDRPETFLDTGLLDNEFSNYIVYLERSSTGLVTKIALTKVNFKDIGSKHAHMILNMMPDNFYYLFSGEIMRGEYGIEYNLNSGMFYNIHIDSTRENNVKDLHHLDYIASFLVPEYLNWDIFSKIVLESLLQERVIGGDILVRPNLILNVNQLDEYCNVHGFSLKEYPNKRYCENNSVGRERCEK